MLLQDGYVIEPNLVACDSIHYNRDIILHKVRISVFNRFKMSLSDSDLTKLLQAQLSIQVAVTTLLEGQRKIVEMIMTMCKKEKGKFPCI